MTATFARSVLAKIILLSSAKPGTETFQARDESLVRHVTINCSPEHKASKLRVTLPMANIDKL